MQSSTTILTPKKQKKEKFVSISKGNDKLGNIPNISLPPGQTCKIKCKFCYAMKFYKRKNVKQAWDKNYNVFRHDPFAYFSEIDSFLRKSKSTFFRYHVGGDIINEDYFRRMVDLAKVYKKIDFNVYTKRFDILEEYIRYNKIPENLIVLLSTAPNYFPDKVLNEFRKTWIIGLNNLEYNSLIPTDPSLAFMCPCGIDDKKVHCDKCKVCYSKTDKRDVVFHLH